MNRTSHPWRAGFNDGGDDQLVAESLFSGRRPVIWTGKGTHVGLRFDDPELRWVGGIAYTNCAESYSWDDRHVVAWVPRDDEPYPRVLCSEHYESEVVRLGIPERPGLDDQREHLRRSDPNPPETPRPEHAR